MQTGENVTDHFQKEEYGRKTASSGMFNACPSDSDYGWTMEEFSTEKLKARGYDIKILYTPKMLKRDNYIFKDALILDLMNPKLLNLIEHLIFPWLLLCCFF